MKDFDFTTPPSVMMRSNASKELGHLLKDRFKSHHVFLITDAGLVTAGIIAPVLTALEDANIRVTLYDSVVADPPEVIIMEAISIAKTADVDCIVGLGGGSPMDVAKVIAVMLSTKQELTDIYGVGNVTMPRTTPLVLLPTTAGTGSEVTPISIVTTGETTKTGIVAPQLFADLAILDPMLTLGLPAHITAATGIDAMVHAFEAYTSRHKKNAISDMLAKEALQKLYANLLRVCENGDDIEARSEMLLGSMLAGQAFANAPVAAVHALAYPIGGIFHVSHGLSNALVMPHVLRYNLDTAMTEYATLAEVIAPSQSGSLSEKAEAFITHMATLSNATGIPQSLTEVGITENDLNRLASDAMLQTRLLVNNPREMTQEDAHNIYRAAL